MEWLHPTYKIVESQLSYHNIELDYWRAGASQPSGVNGAIFPLYIYLYVYIFITGAAYVVSNSTLHAYAHAHEKLQSDYA